MLTADKQQQQHKKKKTQQRRPREMVEVDVSTLFVHQCDAPRQKRFFRGLFGRVLLVLAVVATSVVITNPEVWARGSETVDLGKTENTPIVTLAVIVWSVILFIMWAWKSAGSTFPLNVIFLTLFTLASAYLASGIARRHNPFVVLHTMAIIMVLVAVLFAYCCLPCGRYSQLGAAVSSLLFLLVIASIIVLPNLDAFRSVGWRDVVFGQKPEDVSDYEYAWQPVSVWFTLVLTFLLLCYLFATLHSISENARIEEMTAASIFLVTNVFTMFVTLMMAIAGLASCSYLRACRGAAKS